MGLKKLVQKIAEAVGNGTWLPVRKGLDRKGNVVEGAVAEGGTTTASGSWSHAEGGETKAIGDASHAEGDFTVASGFSSHAEGSHNYDDPSFIHMIGVGGTPEYNVVRKNAVAVYAAYIEESDDIDVTNPKNGYQYLLDVGGYKGQAVTEGMKSVQEVIADLEKGVAATETMTVEDIREIMSA